jgi:hypothetical protein
VAKNNLPKRLFKTTDRVSSYQHDRSPTRRMKEMARDHQDVLQNIEFALVNAHRADARVDDGVVLAALTACRTGKSKESDEPRVLDVVDLLDEIRALREDVADDVWAECLQVVEDSVRRHSDRRPRETSYLDFAARFIR